MTEPHKNSLMIDSSIQRHSVSPLHSVES